MITTHRRPARAIDAIRVNTLSREVRGGRALIVKKRRRGSRVVAQCANAFFRSAGHPVFVWSDPARWQQWEIGCFNLLHQPENFHAFADGARTVCADILPGVSLAEHFENGTFDPAMLDAAASELWRAHALPWELAHEHGQWRRHSGEPGGWSHGDANLANVLFATRDGRARLIDFELAHHPALPEAERHAEDLLVFLQDLLGCCYRIEVWVTWAMRFLQAYGMDSPAVAALRPRLAVPRPGPARTWWWIRTNYVAAPERQRRVAALREALGWRSTAGEMR